MTAAENQPDMEPGPGPGRPPKGPDEPPNNRGLLGVLFVVVLIVGAIWLVDRMRLWASMGDCAFTHAPQCRELLER